MNHVNGDEIRVIIDRDGLGVDKGIGYLPDNTMVVVVGAGGKVGEEVRASIVRMESTPAGCSFLANAL